MEEPNRLPYINRIYNISEYPCYNIKSSKLKNLNFITAVMNICSNVSVKKTTTLRISPNKLPAMLCCGFLGTMVRKTLIYVSSYIF